MFSRGDRACSGGLELGSEASTSRAFFWPRTSPSGLNRNSYVPLVHFGGDSFQVWGSRVGGRERFGCNSVVGWHVSDVS